METTDKELLRIYMEGFNNELDGKPRQVFDECLKQSAYNEGVIDAIVGDEVSSSDNKSNEEILRVIKNKK